PVTFFVDPDLAENADMDSVRQITLSYTFYASSEAQQAMPAHAKPNHDYHLVNPSPWPLVGSLSAFIMAVGATGCLHDMMPSWLFFIGVAGLLYTMYAWWSDVIREGKAGDHTPVVQIHHRYGMMLFITSEVMFFVAWFWAYFDGFFNVAAPEQLARLEHTG